MASARIYIRHGIKAYDNGRAPPGEPQFDPPLVDSLHNAECGRTLAATLLRAYGPPREIICSPFLRTRQTALLLAAELRILSGWDGLVRVDCALSEYLGHHPNAPLDVAAETAKYRPPHPETMDDLRSRVARHWAGLEGGLTTGVGAPPSTPNATGVLWFVTHGLVIKKVQALRGSGRMRGLGCWEAVALVGDQEVVFRVGD